MAWKHRHLVDVDVFSEEDLYTVLEEAVRMEEVMKRPLKKVPALRGKVVANMFFEPSTRTRTSFELAEKFLSADVINWSFFFQAEDGIRDKLVTGVQTCALPI